MAARLHAAEVLLDRKTGAYHVTIPAYLASLIGRDAWLRCRLDAVCHADQMSARSFADSFEAEFHQPRMLVLPRKFTRRHKLAVGARIDITIEDRLAGATWAFWRRNQAQPLHPGETLVIDMGDDEVPDPRHAALAQEKARLGALRHRLATEMAAIQAAIDSSPEDEELRRVSTVVARDVRPVPVASGNIAVFEQALAARRGHQDDPPPPAAPSQVPARTAARQAYTLRRAAG